MAAQKHLKGSCISAVLVTACTSHQHVWLSPKNDDGDLLAGLVAWPVDTELGFTVTLPYPVPKISVGSPLFITLAYCAALVASLSSKAVSVVTTTDPPV